ncbi:MAG TPA: ABC transporter [Bacteroidales bacterium]|nr:ABC transporter [Bacteroidales bacterium]
MRKIIYIALIAFLVSCSPSKKELFELTDFFVESLQTTYESYGILGGTDHMKITSDGQYQVMPIGRLINVKILKVVNNDVYKDLEKDLEAHYRNDKRVNGVYISNAGTIMIDCRN